MIQSCSSSRLEPESGNWHLKCNELAFPSLYVVTKARDCNTLEGTILQCLVEANNNWAFFPRGIDSTQRVLHMTRQRTVALSLSLGDIC